MLWATTKKLHNNGTGAEFAFSKDAFVCKRIVWSPDQKRLLVLGAEDSDTPYVTDAYVLEATSLHLVRHLKTAYAWWRGSHYFYEDDQGRLISSTGKSLLVPSNLEICTADAQTGYILGATPLPHGRPSEEYAPAYLLSVWKQTSRGKLRRVHVIGKTYFDPGSTGVPCAFGLVNRQRVLVGNPHGGAYDTLRVVDGKRWISLDLHTNKTGYLNELMNERGPYPTESSLFGLVRPVTLSNEPRKEPYLYQVTKKTIKLMKLGKDIVLIYYDPIRHAIGLGSNAINGVAVRYIPDRRIDHF